MNSEELDNDYDSESEIYDHNTDCYKFWFNDCNDFDFKTNFSLTVRKLLNGPIDKYDPYTRESFNFLLQNRQVVSDYLAPLGLDITFYKECFFIKESDNNIDSSYSILKRDALSYQSTIFIAVLQICCDKRKMERKSGSNDIVVPLKEIKEKYIEANQNGLDEAKAVKSFENQLKKFSEVFKTIVIKNEKVFVKPLFEYLFNINVINKLKEAKENTELSAVNKAPKKIQRQLSRDDFNSVDSNPLF